jgi:ribosomal protein S18 acetylase RimI-like enzyme
MAVLRQDRPMPARSDVDVRIRKVTPADAEAVLALWRVVFPEYGDASHPQRNASASVARKLAFGDGLFWAAERGGSLAGTAMAGYDGHRGWLYSVGVHPDDRGVGIGRALVQEAERALAALGCPKVNLQVFASNAGGCAFWRDVGYAEDGVMSFGKRLGT